MLAPAAPVQARLAGDALGERLGAQLGGLDLGGGAPVQRSVEAGSGSGGLGPQVRAGMEAAFGESFADVRVHRDSDAATRIGARAYAQGSELHFAPGAYQPASQAGRELIGHELAHVVQQRAGRVAPTAQLLATGQPLNRDASLEREADQLGARAAQLSLAAPGGAAAAPVQRSCAPGSGRAASGAVGVVQGYFDYDPAVSGNYAMTAGATFESQRLVHGVDAEHQRRTLTAAGANPNQLAETQTHHDGAAWVGGAAANVNLPPLHIAHQGMMAIEKTDAQPRVFYCDPGLVGQANQILSDNVSETALLQDGAALTVPTTDPALGPPAAQRALQRVRPGQRANGLGPIAARTHYNLTECNRIIQEVIGSAQRTEVLGTGGAQTTLSEKEPVYEVAERMTRPGARPGRLGAKIDDGRQKVDDTDKAQVETDYSQLAPVDRDRRAQRLGVNEHASPGIGEGYVVNSLKSTLPSRLNTTFNGPGDRQRYRNALAALDAANLQLDVFTSGLTNDAKALKKNVWSNHYAGVVAKSGADTVTLENYNRVQERKWEISHIFDELYRQSNSFQRKAWRMRATLEARDEDAQLDIMRNMVTSKAHLQGLLLRASQAHARMTSSPAREMLYFQMYGPGAQSFHAKMAGISANAVTMRTRIDLEAQRRDRTQMNTNKATRLLGALDARINTAGVTTAPLQALRLQVQALQGLIDNDIVAATTQRMMNAALTRINLDYVPLRDQIRDALAADLLLLEPTAQNCTGQALNVLQTELGLRAGAAHIGLRVRGRDTARQHKYALIALRDIANDL